MNHVGVTCLVLAGLAASLGGCASVGERRAFDEVAAVENEFHASESRTDAQPTLPALGEGSRLEEYLAYAALNNPGLEAAFNRWKAALERVPQVRSLPDPRFNYAYFIEEVETRVGPQRNKIGISQVFPWFGKLDLQGDAALESANAERERYEAAKLRLFYEVKDAYYEYYYLGRAVEIVKKNRDLVKYLEEVARARYRAAAAQHQDLIRAQVELGKLDNVLRSLTDLRGPIVARLNAALNRPIQADVPWPETIPEEQIDATDEQLLGWLRETNPDLKAFDHEIAEHERAVDLAGKEYYPDFTLGLDYTDVGSARGMEGQGLSAPFAQRSAVRLGQGMGDALDVYSILRSFEPGDRPSDSGKDVWMLWASINVPIWFEKYRAGEREAQARLRAATNAKAERENTLSSRMKMVVYNLRDADRKIDLYRDTLVPKARQSLNATETAFRAGKASFLDLVDTERVLLEFELSYERALASHAQRLAELEMLVGREIPRRESSVDGS